MNINYHFQLCDLNSPVIWNTKITLETLFDLIRNSYIPISDWRKILRCSDLEKYMSENGEEVLELDYIEIEVSVVNGVKAYILNGVRGKDKVVIDMSPVSKWKRTPIILSNKVMFYDDGWNMGEEKEIEFRYPMTWLDLFSAVFDGGVNFWGSITERDDQVNKIKSRIASIESGNVEFVDHKEVMEHIMSKFGKSS